MRRKMTRASWGMAPEGSPRELRTEHVTELERYVREQFALHSELRSAILAVAQYWADEADDAVHAMVVFSERETPFWPHQCDWNGDGDGDGPALTPADQCSSCGDYGWLSFDDNGDAIPAFQSCCREDASQESDAAEAYLPYAVVRRVQLTGVDTFGKSVETEIIGGPVRAWLDDGHATRSTPSRRHDAQTAPLFELVYATPEDDTPRIVLADHLLQQGDPLGEYISLALTRAEVALEREVLDRMSVLELANVTRWLGPLADVAPPERAELARGFVRTVAVHLADEGVADRVAAAPEWGTVERLWFLPNSVQRLSSTMKALRSVGPLDAAGIEQLARLGSKLPIERVYVNAQTVNVLARLADMDLPALRRLGVGGTPRGTAATTRTGRNPFTGETITITDPQSGRAFLGPEVLEPITHAAFWSRLEELVIMSVEPSVIAAWIERSPSSRPKALTFIGAAPTLEPAGFRLRVVGDAVLVDMPSVGSETTFALLAEMLRAVPSSVTRAAFASTRWFAPTDEDLHTLSAATRREITRA